MKTPKGSRQLAVISLAVLAVLLISLSWALADTSPPLQEWNRTFGGEGGDGGSSVQETSDGGYIIAGSTSSFGAGGSDVYLVKTDSLGLEEWSTTFGGSSSDYGYSVQQTSDGGYIIAGETNSFGAGGYDIYLVKTDSQGLKEWNTTFGGSGEEKGASVQQTSDGGYIIAGETARVRAFRAGEYDVYVVKTDSQGVEEWSTTFGGSGEEMGYSVQQTSDGGYIIAGETWPIDADGVDVYLVKVDSQGVEEWIRALGGSGLQRGYSVQQTSDGGYIIAGEIWPLYAAGMYDYYLLKTDSQGVEEWSTAFGGSEFDFGRSVQETSDGGYIITGSTRSFGAGEADVYLVKTDSQGLEEWNTTFGGSESDSGASVQETSDGGYIIAGSSSSFGSHLGDVYLVKLGSQGEDDGGARELSLFEGWNFIGLPFTPEDPSIQVVLADILDYVNSVWTFNGETETWSSYSPGAPSSLTEMVDYRGYWIQLTEDVTLTVHGESVDTSEVALFEGWNFIGLPLTPVDTSIGVVLADIIDNVESVWAFNGETKAWSSYSPGAPSALTEMVDDKGYWIRMAEDATLTVHR